MDTLAGKVALVTGAAKGIGLAIASLFAREGARVAISARRLEDAQRACEAVGACDAVGANAMPLRLDVADRAQWDAAVGAIDAAWGRLDCLVNCAGVIKSASTEGVSEEDWRLHMAVNLDGAFHGCRAALPLMRRGFEPCSIINISSIYGQRPAGGFAGYSVSKAALTALTKVLALELAAGHPPIRVNSVHPGGTETEMLELAIAETGLAAEEGRRMFVAQHPMARLGSPDEVAAACLWLASPASSFTTGLELNVDGGAYIRN